MIIIEEDDNLYGIIEVWRADGTKIEKKIKLV